MFGWQSYKKLFPGEASLPAKKSFSTVLRIEMVLRGRQEWRRNARNLGVPRKRNGKPIKNLSQDAERGPTGGASVKCHAQIRQRGGLTWLAHDMV
jgi:hypothetical protein